MAASDGRPVPIKNTAFRVTFPIYDNDGDLVSSAAGLDSEVSKDGGAFADCTNEATEIAQGIYYLDLTSTEMNADTVAVIVKTSTTDAKTTVLVFYPEESGDINVDVTAMAADVITATVIADNAIDAGALAADAITAAKIADNAIDAGAIAANAITSAKIAADAIGASQIATDAIGANELAAGAVAEIAAAILTTPANLLATDGSGFTTVATNNDKTGYRLSSTGIDDILDDPISEPSAAFAWSSATLRKILQNIGAFTNNKITATSGVITLRNEADSANIATGSQSDDGTTYTRSKFA